MWDEVDDEWQQKTSWQPTQIAGESDEPTFGGEQFQSQSAGRGLGSHAGAQKEPDEAVGDGAGNHRHHDAGDERHPVGADGRGAPAESVGQIAGKEGSEETAEKKEHLDDVGVNLAVAHQAELHGVGSERGGGGTGGGGGRGVKGGRGGESPVFTWTAEFAFFLGRQKEKKSDVN